MKVNLPRWFAAFWWRNGWKTGWRRGLVGKPSRNVEEPALRHRVSDEGAYISSSHLLHSWRTPC